VSGQLYSYRLDRMIEDYQNAGIRDGWHHWDARLKLLLLVVAIGLNVVIANAWLSAALLAVSLVFIVRSKIPFRLFAIFFLAPAWATLLVFVGFSVGSEMSWIAALMLTTPFPQLLEALHFYRVPAVLIGAFAMAYRYAFLLADECYRMIAASRVRGGLNTFFRKIESLAMIVAQVIIRAYDRAARLQQAMMTRGADFADADGRMAVAVDAEIAEAPSSPPDRHYDCLMPSTGISPAALALECRNLSFAYKRGGARVIDDLTLSVASGEVIAVCGPNGCGKSTFLKLVTGVLRPLSGEVRLLGIPSDQARRNEAFRFVGLLFQDPNDQVFCTHVREDIAYGPRNLGLDRLTIDKVVTAAMALAEISHLGARSVHQLSFGEMKRIGLAGLIAMRQPLMLLDEPSAYLDPAATRQLLQIVKRLNAEYGYTFIVVTHDMELVAELATRVLIMQDGRIVADGKPRDILTNQALLASARLEPPTLTRMFSELGRTSGAPSDIPLTVAEAKALLHDRRAPEEGPSP
jgi:energy-coupling factor transporter ATP-binding protein EcfA2/energy-coupling factor transporter transmembrane protein EcfT